MMPTAGERGAWLIAGTGMVGSVIGWMIAPAQFPHAWLAAVTCFLGWPLGSIALVLIHALTGGRWGYAIRPQLAAGIATLPVLLPALVPLVLAAHALYPWTRAGAAWVPANHFYLNAPFFCARAALYLTVWLGLALRVQGALRQDDSQARLYRLAPPALMLLALTVTFAAIDSTLSLEPQFKSSIYGMLECTESILLALSIALAGMARAGRSEDIPAIRDLSRLLLALLVLWAYLDFMQILIIWNSDLPDEAGWYLQRLAGTWAPLAIAIAALHFLLPFFALLWPAVQRSRKAIASIAALLALIEIPRAWWNVIPASGRGPDWVDAAAMMAVLGLAAGIALRFFRSRAPTAYSND
ncbi:MAG TPA: hypothetical protein VHW71_16775 [Steroidobacteraceae bacterium]|jgi:hypothetical protein|nr:hypothetical protein [Steroidobacteraceae bacterium]